MCVCVFFSGSNDYVSSLFWSVARLEMSGRFCERFRKGLIFLRVASKANSM